MQYPPHCNGKPEHHELLLACFSGSVADREQACEAASTAMLLASSIVQKLASPEYHMCHAMLLPDALRKTVVKGFSLHIA